MAIGTYTPPPLQIITQNFFPIFFFFFFHFRCILLQISHKKCFFISISILGRSGVNKITIFFRSSQLNCPCKSSQNRYEKCRRSPDIVTEKGCINTHQCERISLATHGMCVKYPSRYT